MWEFLVDVGYKNGNDEQLKVEIGIFHLRRWMRKVQRNFLYFKIWFQSFPRIFWSKKKLNLWQSQEFILEIELVLQLCLSKSSHIILFSREYCLKNVYATRMAKNHVHSYSCINLIRLWEHFSLFVDERSL